MRPMNMSITLQNGDTSMTLTCEADRADSYSWERQGGDSIPSGATGVNTNMLTFNNLQLEDAGNYRCIATNDGGTVPSNYATLTLTGEQLSLSL